MKVGFISLGCSKNLVDTEMMIGLMKEHKLEIVNQEEEADILIINTCGFIESAKQEAIDTILEMAKYKQTGKCKFLVATGCLVQRYQKELEKLLPEVDLWISIDEYPNFWRKMEELLKIDDTVSYGELDYLKRVITTGKKTAYLKIAEGCSNFCTYCAIPYIRGKYQSRKMEDVLAEAKQLAKEGIQEIILIAQDTTKYGMDLYEESKLPQLLHEISQIDGIQWIRFLYAYPETITDKLIQEVKNNPKVCHYFDIPIQHIADTVLKRMNRKSDGASIRALIQKLRQEIPDVILRTSLIVGFPGETKEEFEKLYQFVADAKFDKLGVFMYSKEDGTPAAKMKEQIHYQTKKSRWNRIMQEQSKISEEKLAEKMGKKYTALLESVSPDGAYYIGRTYMDVPDMDGVIVLEKEKEIPLGTFVECEITGICEYDLAGKILE